MPCMQIRAKGTTGIFRPSTRPGLGGLRVAAALALAAPMLRAQRIVPEVTPDPGIGEFHFPESEATLTGWITDLSRGRTTAAASAAFEKIHLHGWGLWTALTAEAAQVYGGQRLRVFETWPTPEDLASRPDLRSIAPLGQQSRRRAPLRALSQLQGRVRAAATPATLGANDAVGQVVGYVKLDPTAANHILKQGLLKRSALDALLQGGAQQIPVFPATAIAAKSVFQIIRAGDLVDGRYYCLKAWSGPPDTVQEWGPVQWPGAVWIDVLGSGSGRGAVDQSPSADGSTRTEETTYPLSNLISYRLSADDATALNQDKPGTGAAAGDYAILVAMHIAGREIVRWTWQTYWWTPAPDDPPAPSSAAIANLRPPQLRGAPRHYAMALGYTMLTPDQPYVGGENSGAAVYTYNPWIEARFGPADLPDSRAGFDPAGRPAANNYGVQTNCMSCHAQATYNPNKLATAPRLTGARYVDLIDPQFVGTLQVDFLWSISRHATSPSAPEALPLLPVANPAPVSSAVLPPRFPTLPLDSNQNLTSAQP